MKKINRFLIIYMIVITVLCAYMCYLAFTRNENIDKIQEGNNDSAKGADKSRKEGESNLQS